jgi:sugar phosphate isomerase/epimerase
LAIRLEILPGNSILDKFVNAARYGFDAVELPGRYLNNYITELLACKNDLTLDISSISLGYRGSLLNANDNVRAQCRQDIKELLSLCAKLGAIGLVMPPILHKDAPTGLTDAQTGTDTKKAKDNLLLEQLPELADHAHKNGVVLLLEPVNKFETDYLNTIDHALSLCKKLNHPGLAITADLFHMQIEELEPINAILNAGKWIKHVHIAENTRVEPGPGSLNFEPLFRALLDIGYAGYIVTECRSLSGPADQTLPYSAQYIRKIINRCRGKT